MRVHIITIGDEILIGQIVDTNSAWMGQQLNLIGTSVTRISTIGDEQDEIQNTVTYALHTADVVLLTGGLGPTRDDKTKVALADLFGMDLKFHEPTYARIEARYARRGLTPTAAQSDQATVPDGCEILTNRYGSAPGMWFEPGEGRVVVSMPGVPREMMGLMTEEVLPRLQERYQGRAVRHRTLLTVGEGESLLAQRIEDIEDALPPHIKLAYLPGLGQVRLRLSAIGPEANTLETDLAHWSGKLEERLGTLLFGTEKMVLPEVVGQCLAKRGLKLGLAESCTGGYVGYQVTTIPGASAYFSGSVVVYSYELKERLLGVPMELLNAVGAVSEECVSAMVAGALDRLDCNIALAVSGIAGPGGGTPDKPVGTIWIAIGDQHRTETHLLHLNGSRTLNMSYTAVRALDLLRHYLMRHYPLSEK